MSDSSSASGSPPRKDLRRTPRIDVRERLSGHLVSLDRAVRVRDISLGGFSVESDEALPAGVHIVRLQAGERWSVTVTAASRHQSSTRGADGCAHHVMGFEYEDQTLETQHILRVLVERLEADTPLP
jgi:hypothetical protein